MYSGNKMVDYAVNNKKSQGVAIARPAAQAPPKEHNSIFTVQRTNRGLDGGYAPPQQQQQQQLALSARGTSEAKDSYPVGGQLSSGEDSGRQARESSCFPSPGLRNLTEFSPHRNPDSRIPRAPVADDFLTSNHGSNIESDRMGGADKGLSSPGGSNIPNFLRPGSQPTTGPRGPDSQEAVQKMYSGSMAEVDQGAGQPSYQRYIPGSVALKGTSSLGSTRKGAPRKNELSVGKGRFIMKNQKIGAGSFGEIYWGIDTVTNKEVAIKLESVKVRHPQLLYESRIYKLLHSKDTNFHPSVTRYNRNTFFTTNKVVPTRGGAFVEALRGNQQADDGSPNSGKKPMLSPATFQELREVVGFPKCYFYGTEGEYNVLVMDLLGPNLEDLFNYCRRRFSLKTVCLLADQMLHRIEYLHHKGFIHRDLKPENFVMGGEEERAHVLYLIDYGLSKRYLDPRTNLHVTYKEGKSLTGTARYCSINAHLGIEQSRRDDIEALGYILLYFLKHGFLPWQGIRGVTDPQTKNVRISEKKINTRLEVLCRDEPIQILKFMTYARGLKFEETPDYTSCREFFASLVDRHNWERDGTFDWVLRRQADRQREQQQQQAFPLLDNPNPLLANRLPMLNGQEAHLLGSPVGYNDVEAKNSNQFNLNSPTELSALLSTVDDVEPSFSEMGGINNKYFNTNTAGHTTGGAHTARNNTVWDKTRYMQTHDLPGDMEYML